MPRPLITPGKDPVSILQEAGWAPGPVWTGAENLAPHRDSIPGPSSPQPVAIPIELPGPLTNLQVLQNASLAQELLVSPFQKFIAVICYTYNALTAHLLTPLTRTTVDCPETKLEHFWRRFSDETRTRARTHTRKNIVLQQNYVSRQSPQVLATCTVYGPTET